MQREREGVPASLCCGCAGNAQQLRQPCILNASNKACLLATVRAGPSFLRFEHRLLPGWRSLSSRGRCLGLKRTTDSALNKTCLGTRIIHTYCIIHYRALRNDPQARVGSAAHARISICLHLKGTPYHATLRSALQPGGVLAKRKVPVASLGQAIVEAPRRVERDERRGALAPGRRGGATARGALGWYRPSVGVPRDVGC